MHYAEDPAWVQPLLTIGRERLSIRKNPYFQHAEAVCFLAERCGKVVGRISAQVCSLVQEHHGSGTGHFGSFECENRPETARALFKAAEQWLRHQGMTRVLGPFDLSINDEVGMLVEGFETPPYVMMGHHRKYYATLMNEVGYRKEMDLGAYFLDISKPYTDRIQRVVERASRDSRIVIRAIDKSEHHSGLRHVLDVFKEAWSDNWGYLPPTDAEVENLIRQMQPLLHRGRVVLAEVENELAGFMIVLPNLNEFIRDLNGRIFPVGWSRLLWRLRFGSFRSVRVPLMGVRKKFQASRIGASIALAMIDHCRTSFLPMGVTDCEMSWILESNIAMNSILEAAGCERYKSYRIFSKSLKPVA